MVRSNIIENRKYCKIAKQEGSNTNCNLCIGMGVLLALFDKIQNNEW